MSMIFYGLKTCDTCRKAQKEIKAAGHNLIIIDVRADGVGIEKLTEWVEKADWKKLLNTRSTSWRNLSDAEKADVDAQKAIALMAQYPTLIKRPVIERGGSLSVGWTADVKEKILS